jgi:hypothetical protein
MRAGRAWPQHEQAARRESVCPEQPAHAGIGRLVLPGIFDGTHQFALDDLGGHTRLTQSETFRGVLVPFTGKTITQTEGDFRALSQALKQRVERAAR